LLPEQQKRRRSILSLQQQPEDTRFLRLRSIFVGERSTDDDLMGQMLVALLQAGVIGQDELTGGWFQQYLCRFLSRRAKQLPPQVQAEIVAVALHGLWKNAGNAEFAGAWRRYVKTWVRWSERHVVGGEAVRPEAEKETDDDDADRDTLSRQREAARGALAPNRIYRRDVRYAVPVEGEGGRERVSVAELASMVGMSVRHVFRLVKAGELRPVQRAPFMFDAADAREWSSRWADKHEARRVRKKKLGDLMRSRPGLTLAGARKAEYRREKRTG
jgi:hypothetical protein